MSAVGQPIQPIQPVPPAQQPLGQPRQHRRLRQTGSGGIAPRRGIRWLILGVIGLLFAIPIISMVEFTLRAGLAGGYTFNHWIAIFDPAQASASTVQSAALSAAASNNNVVCNV